MVPLHGDGERVEDALALRVPGDVRLLLLLLRRDVTIHWKRVFWQTTLTQNTRQNQFECDEASN